MGTDIEYLIVELHKFMNTWADGREFEVDLKKIPMDEALAMLADVMDIFGLQFVLKDRSPLL